MHAVILLSHGSVRSDAGQELEAHAERLRARGIAPLVAVGYLNYTAPDFASTVAACVAQGATRITVAPYFLVPGKFVEISARTAVAALATKFPGIAFQVAAPIGYDPRLAGAILESAKADFVLLAATTSVVESGPPLQLVSIHENPSASGLTPPPTLASHSPSALLVLAHGSPHSGANDSLLQVVREVREQGLYTTVQVGFLECNAPAIPSAIAQCVATGVKRVLGVPYFLHSGRHVQEDLPALLQQARETYPGILFSLAEMLGRSPILTSILESRITACSDTTVPVQTST